ncbi:MAG: NlpC/P60 family protein [Thermodesulfobacteriota bacterium]
MSHSGIRVKFKAAAMAVFLFVLAVGMMSCAGPGLRKKGPGEIPRLGYAVQVGAFSDVNNAARLTESLRQQGLDATYLVARAGLYKVRFGNFSTREAARRRAEGLKSKGVIEEFYIVQPEEYAAYKRDAYGESYLREEIIKTAESFIGLPYLWGGTSADTGFDCSGLTLAVYRINGLDLPRSSGEQYEKGEPVKRGDLARGDLVFFSNTGGKISHVGIYAGEGRFIHAPGRGKTVRYDSLDLPYFRDSFRGARSYV